MKSRPTSAKNARRAGIRLIGYDLQPALDSPARNTYHSEDGVRHDHHRGRPTVRYERELPLGAATQVAFYVPVKQVIIWSSDFRMVPLRERADAGTDHKCTDSESAGDG